MTFKEFMALKDDEYVAFGRQRCIVRGRNDYKEPRIFKVSDGAEISGAVYNAHIYTPCGAPPPPPEPVEEEKIVVPEVKQEVEQISIEFALPVAKKRGRKPKAPK